ncbi:hypothetical protein ACFX2B_026914 [Malus domestica]
MLQISPSAKVAMSPVIGGAVSSSLRGIKTSPDSAAMFASDMIINRNSSSAAKGCLLENTGMHISSPRNPGIKRRVVANLQLHHHHSPENNAVMGYLQQPTWTKGITLRMC